MDYDKTSNIFAEETNHWIDVSSPASLLEKVPKDLGLEVKPMYKQIKATYLSLNEAEPFSPEDLERDGIFVMYGIGKGVEVTKTDVTAMRQAQYDMFMPRNPLWAQRRAVSSFLGLNICNMVVLVLAAVLCFLIYLNNSDICPNFSRATLFYAILAVIWVAFTALGIYSAHKRIVNNLRYYMIGLSFVLLLGVCVTGYGLLTKDKGPECNDDSSQTIILISTGVFALLDIGFFLILCKKLRNTMLQQQNRSNNNRNVSRNINSNRNNAPNVVLSTGAQSNRAINAVERGNRSDRQPNRNNNNRADRAYRVTGNSSRSRGRV